MIMASSSRRNSFGSRSSGIINGTRRLIGYTSNDKNSNSSSSHAESDNDGIVKVPVVGYEVMEERAKYTVFKLRVENEELNETWLVFRRYTDFERLSSKLKEEFPELSINLPPKRWLKNNFDTSFLEDRMKGLQAFVDSILIQHKLGSSPTVRTFFCLDEPHPLYPENAEESRTIFGNLEDTVIQLKEVLDERETEIEYLKAELALVKTQNETLTKFNSKKICRACTRKLSQPLSPFCKNGEPVASSTPNDCFFTPRARTRSSRSDISSASPCSNSKVMLKFNSENESPLKDGNGNEEVPNVTNDSSSGNTLPLPDDSAKCSQSSPAAYCENESPAPIEPFPVVQHENFSPFELIPSSDFSVLKETDNNNSSFEVLSNSQFSISSKDSNHNRKNPGSFSE